MSFILRLVVLYFIWVLARRLWRRYVVASAAMSQAAAKGAKKADFQDIHEAEFRVLREGDN